MIGVVYRGDRRCSLVEVPQPPLQPDEVLVRVKAAGICGSDLRWYRFTPQQLERYSYPAVFGGHETAGVVEALGESVRHLAVGQRVAVYHYMGCGTCYHCRSGDIHYCPNAKAMSWHIHGGIADVVLAKASSCVPLPDSRSFEEGSLLMCAAGTAHTAMKYSAPTAQDFAVVHGLGPVGLLITLYLRAHGARTVGVDINAYRRALAKQLGADEVIDPASADVAGALADLTRGAGVDVSFECTGQPGPRQLCTKTARKRGRVCLVGISHEVFDGAPPAISGEDVIVKELTLRGVNIFPLPGYWETVEFLSRRGLKADAIVTHRFPLNRAAEAFRIADSGECGKVVVEA